MESLNKRLSAVQDELLNLYEEASDLLQQQVVHWNLMRRESVLLYFARQAGIMRVGMQPVPALQVSAERAKSAIELQLVLQSLCDSPYATETWTLSDTSRERWMAAPERCWKRGARTVEVIFDCDAGNSMQYTLWEWIYYQDSADNWQKARSQVDHKGIWFWDCEHKHYYEEFAADAERYSATGHWDVTYNNETISPCDPVTSTTPPTDPRGEAELHPRRDNNQRPTGRRAGDGGEEHVAGEAPPQPQTPDKLPADCTPSHASPLPDSTSNSPESVPEPCGRSQRFASVPLTPESVGAAPKSAPGYEAPQPGPVTTEQSRASRKRAGAGAGGSNATRGKRRPPGGEPTERQPPVPADEPLLVSEPGDPGLGSAWESEHCGGGSPLLARSSAVPTADPGPLGPPSPARGSLTPPPQAPLAAAAREPPDRAQAAFQGRVPVARGHRGRPEHLLREAGDSPAAAVVLVGPPNPLKCLRYRLTHTHGHRYQYCSTTWYWTGQGANRLGPARMLLTFRDSQQLNDFFQVVRLPPSITRAPSLLAV
ncbi:E2 [Canis familiaris papillomavirus 14]|uniref:Regulatory protein E2 n=1 Tax=Canis familiaris papillomavirus 14 TaxID=1236767 RepID=K7QH99_9PAPI|nr:E2 [Canis familiaris papillomavirus 14]AFU07673.1 E2 [Canis familiaris papillomavirus 14]